MITDNENKGFSRLAEDFRRLKTEISTIIDKGREVGLKSENIVDEILSTVAIDKEIVIGEEPRTERPVNIKEIVLIARKAVEQAEFEGVFVVLPTGERIKRRVTCGLD